MGINKGILTKKTFLTEDVVELTIKTDNVFLFQAGQYVSIKIYDNPEKPCFRAYSIASAPEENTQNFTICTKLIKEGRASEWFKTLEEGYEIEFLGPIGKFTFQENSKKALFIAVGTGIAPFKSIIEDQLKNGNQHEMHLIFGIRYEKDIFYKELFEKLAEKYTNFLFELTLSKPENPDWRGKIGRVTNVLKELPLSPAHTEAYICGLKEMVVECTEILTQKGLTETQIHFEKFD